MSVTINNENVWMSVTYMYQDSNLSMIHIMDNRTWTNLALECVGGNTKQNAVEGTSNKNKSNSSAMHVLDELSNHHDRVAS